MSDGSENDKSSPTLSRRSFLTRVAGAVGLTALGIGANRGRETPTVEAQVAMPQVPNTFHPSEQPTTVVPQEPLDMTATPEVATEASLVHTETPIPTPTSTPTEVIPTVETRTPTVTETVIPPTSTPTVTSTPTRTATPMDTPQPSLTNVMPVSSYRSTEVSTPGRRFNTSQDTTLTLRPTLRPDQVEDIWKGTPRELVINQPPKVTATATNTPTQLDGDR